MKMRLWIVDDDEKRWDEGEDGALYRLLGGQEACELLAPWPYVRPVFRLLPDAVCSQEEVIAGATPLCR